MEYDEEEEREKEYCNGRQLILWSSCELTGNAKGNSYIIQ